MRRLLASLALVACLPAAALAQEDESGATFLERFLERNLSGAGRDVRVTGFQGALSSTASMQRLTIADDQGVWLTLEDVALDWNRSALLRGRLSVNTLTADSIDLARLPSGGEEAAAPSPEASGFRLPELPVAIRIGEISSPEITLGEPVIGVASAFSLEGALTLEGGEGTGTIDIRRTDGPEGRFQIDASFANETGILDLVVDLEEAPGGIVSTLAGFPGEPSVSLDVTGQGPLTDFEATLTLATDGAERLDGLLTIGGEGLAPGDPRPFRAELRGDVAPLFAPAYQDFFGNEVALNVAGTRAADGSLDLPTLSLSARSVSLDGSVALGPGGTPRSFDLDGRIASDDGEPVLLPVPGEVTRVGSVTLSAAFDAASGDAWRGRFEIENPDRPGFTAERLLLDGGGTIGPEGFTADLDFTADALDLGDPAARAALGERVTGRIEIARAADQPLDIRRFDIAGETYALESSGTLDVADRDLAVAGEATVSARDLSVFSGIAGRPLGGAAELTLSGQGAILGGTFDVVAEGGTEDLSVGIAQVDNLVAGSTRLAVDAGRDLTGTTLRRLSVTSPVAAIEADGVIRTSDTRLNLSATLADGTLVLPGLDGRHALTLSATDAAGVWTVRGDLDGATLSGAIDGTLDRTAAAPAWDGTVSVEAASLAPLAGPAGLPGLDGALALRAEGSAVADLSRLDLRLSGTGTGVTTGLPTLDPLLGGEVDLALDALREPGGPLTLRRLDARTDTLALEAAGTVGNLPGVLVPPPADLLSREPAPIFDGRIALRASDLSPVSGLAGLPGLGGSVAASLTGQVAADLSRFDARLSLSEEGLTLGRADLDRLLADGLTATLDAARSVGGPIDLRGLSVATPALSATAQGTVTGLPEDLLTVGAAVLDTAAFDGSVSVDAGDLSPVGRLAGLPDLAGSMRAGATGTLAANLSAFDLSVTASEQGLTLGRPDLDALLSGGMALRLEAERAAGGDVRLGILSVATPTISLNGSGTLSGLPEALVPAPPGLAGSAVFDGRLDLDARDLAPAGPLAGLPGLGGALGASVVGTAAADGGTLDLRIDAAGTNFRTGIAPADAYLAGSTSLAVDVARSDGTFRIREAAFAAPGVRARADGQVGRSGGTISAEVRLDDIGRVVDGFSGPATADLRASVTGSGPWDVRASISGPAATTLRAEGTVARNFGRVDIAVRGDVPLGLADPFIAPRSLGGRAALDLRVSGPPALSSVSGRIGTTDARLVAPTLGVVLEPIAATVTLSGGRAQVDVQSGVQGGGGVSVSGPLTLSAPYAADLRVRLDSARFRDPALFETTVSGDLRLVGPLTGGAAISGRIALGQTEFRVPDGVTGGAAPIPEITHVAESAASRATRIRAGLIDADGNPPGGQQETGGPAYGLDIRIDALNEIFIRGRGLDAELGGSLRIGGTTENVIPAGQFDLIRGRLDILGRRLVMDQGSITLQGSFDPYIRLSASSEADGIVVRVVLEGNISDPDVRFESSPELPEDEIVSRLLFGRGIENISAFQAAQLAASVATLTGAGGEGILSRIRSNLGLDDFDVSTNDEGQTQLTLGTYLTDNLYTDVKVAEGRATVEINLELTPSITVFGASADDGDSSLGIRFERDY